jgi:hypothetical protein
VLDKVSFAADFALDSAMRVVTKAPLAAPSVPRSSSRVQGLSGLFGCLDSRCNWSWIKYLGIGEPDIPCRVRTLDLVPVFFVAPELWNAV